MKYREIAKRKRKWKYELAASEHFQTSILGCNVAVGDFLYLIPDGTLGVGTGYAWDGASGISDSKITRKASLPHDALYQLMRLGLLSREQHRLAADNLFRDLCIAYGGTKFMAGIYWQGLRWFGEKATYPVNDDAHCEEVLEI
jgi:hypothetical protein